MRHINETVYAPRYNRFDMLKKRIYIIYNFWKGRNMKKESAFLVLLLAFVFATIFLFSECACQPIGMQCDLALVLLFDTSESMSSDIGGGETLLNRLQSAATGFVEDVPLAGRIWNMGLTTFPFPATPSLWGMEILNAGNRADLINAINALTPGGFSPLKDSLLWAAFMLQTDDVRPKFMVIFSGKGVCYSEDECDRLLNIADIAKTDYGITIITVGYNLDDTQAEIMRKIASVQDGVAMFYNTGTPEALTAFFEDYTSPGFGMGPQGLSGDGVITPVLADGHRDNERDHTRRRPQRRRRRREQHSRRNL